MRRSLAIFIAGSIALGSVQFAAAADEVPLTPQDVDIRLKQGAPDRYFPEIAQKAGVVGRAEVLCKITATGSLEACQVIAEEPSGCRFGEALVRLASFMKASRRAKDGAPTSGREFVFATSFELPADVRRLDAKGC